MAEVIQFNCPVCGTMLRLPLAMASERGPCPNCDREIIAPDPYRGIGAIAVPLPPPPKQIEPFRPFAEAPLVPKEPETVTAHEQPAAVPAPILVPVCAKPQRAVLVLSCLLTGAVALAWGFALGVRSTEMFMRVPPLTSPMIPPKEVVKPAKTIPEPAVEPKLAGPVPLVVKPMIEIPKIEPATPEPAKASAAAQSALTAFLDAPDWAARSAYVLFSDRVRGAMEAYSREVADGPTEFKSISVDQSHTDSKTGNTLFVFYVKTEKFPAGIPVVVKETPVGWLVDWLAFVEFRDGLFQKFVDGPIDKTGRFHLIVTTPPPDRAANTENEHFSSFLLQSPMSKTTQLAFVRKSSEAFSELQAQLATGGVFTPVLEVVKHKTVEGQNYFEIVKVLATDWLPKEN